MTGPPLLVTVDVEGIVSSGEYRSVDRLDGLLEELDLQAGLFVTPAVVENRPETVFGWIEEGHDVGLHVHPARFEGDRSDWLAEYPPDEITRILGAAVDIFQERIGVRPTTFRAGRWSFSEEMLEALGRVGFDVDASHRPGGVVDPYSSRGVCELPMSVFGSRLLRTILSSRGVDGIPLHADAFLTSRRRAVPFYAVTALVALQCRPYLMMSLHDYDLTDPSAYDRIAAYIGRLDDRLRTTTVRRAAARHNP